MLPRSGFWPLILLAACVFYISSCRAQRPGPENLPRPAPAYMRWMQKESMLNQAPALISQVSQSGRVWLQGSQPGRSDVLLRAAPNWLFLDNADSPPTFSHLAAAIASHALHGLEGIYLGDAGEKPDIIHASREMDPGQPAASLTFDPALGNDGDFEKLAEAAESAGMQTGATLLPGATGQGVDFLLQARNAAGHEGVYAMLPIPAAMEAASVTNEWDCRILGPDQISILDNVAPAILARDEWDWASPGGWAITGAVTGMDGQPRRWIYRYGDNPLRPVLAWQDPSGRAARVLSAGVIRQTGVLGQSLLGLSLEPLLGLEPAEEGRRSLSPGMDAINELSRQIHRYGGWALQADAVPATIIEQVVGGPCDFCRDDVTGLLVAYGLVAADGRPLAALYRHWIAANVDVSRMARGLGADAFIARILLDSASGRQLAAAIAANGSNWGSLLDRLEKKGASRSALLHFELAWRLGMPGLAFLPCRDTPISDAWLANTLMARKNANLALGKLLSVTRGKGGGFGLLSELPGGGCWLFASNFGVNPDQIEVRLPQNYKSATDVSDGASLDIGLSGSIFRLPLDGRAARNVLFK